MFWTFFADPPRTGSLIYDLRFIGALDAQLKCNDDGLCVPSPLRSAQQGSSNFHVSMQASLMLYRSQDGSELRLMQQCGTKTIRYFDRAPSLIEIERIDRGSTGLPDREAHRRAVNRECTQFLQHYTPPPLLAMHRTFLAAPPCACQGVALALPLKRHLSSPQCAGQAERETSKVKTQPRVAWSTRTALKSKKLDPKRSLGQELPAARGGTSRYCGRC